MKRVYYDAFLANILKWDPKFHFNFYPLQHFSQNSLTHFKNLAVLAGTFSKCV